MSVIVPGPIGKNSGIQHLSTAGALPGVERADKVIKLLSEHTAFATWTMHDIPRLLIMIEVAGCYILCAKYADQAFAAAI